jgi:hypothetical protein
MNSQIKKVLILCNDFPPINSIGAERPYSWYRYFREFGLEPVVITKNWTTDGNSSFPQVSEVSSLEQTVFGTIIRAKNVHTPSTFISNFFGNRFSFLRKSFSFIEILFGYYFPFLDRHRSIYKEAINYCKNNEVYAVITTGEPFILFQYGKKLKKQFRVKWLADYRDGWHLNHIRQVQRDFLNRFILKWELPIEKRLTKNADWITSVDPEICERIGKLINRKLDVVYNGFWSYHEQKTEKRENKKIIWNHTGTLTPGQELEVLLDVLVKLYEEGKINENSFQFNLIGLEYFPEQMKRLVPYENIRNKLVFTTPRLSKIEALECNLNADYLINFTDPNLSAIYAKTYDYIACKKPILVIPGDKKQLDRLITENGLGFVLSNEIEISNFIEQPKELRNVKEMNDFFTRKHQVGALVKILLA